MSLIVLNKDQLPLDGPNHEFEGYLHGATNISFIMVELPPGSGPRLHQHPYVEVIIIQEGRAIFTAGEISLEATAGQILIIPAETPHKFVNSGVATLRQLDIHLNKQFVTEWLRQ